MRLAGFLLIIMFSFPVVAQEGTDPISISFTDATIQEVLQDIEDKTSYKFFFVEDWLPNKRISGNYNMVPVEDLLRQVLEGTVLNFYFLDNKVILTKNSVVYDQLPENFFGQPRPEAVVTGEGKSPEIDYNPVFKRNEEVPEVREMETVYIGKAEKGRRTASFILSGVVTSAENGEPISNLAVSILNRNIGTATNDNGYYELKVPAGENILQTSSLGNEDVSKRVIMYNDGTLNLQLKEDYEQLGEIVLETDPDSNVSEAVGGSEEIDVEAIKNIPLVLGERDILKVSTTLPGISTAGEGAAGYNVRGGRADQNLILLDGAVVYNPAHFFGLFSALNPFTTGEVEIYKGTIPAEFGGRLSSVFDMNTRQASMTEFKGEASIGPVTGNLTFEIPIIEDSAGLLLGGRTAYSGWILRSLDEESLKDNEASFYDLTGSYDHKLGANTRLKAMSYYSRDKYNVTTDSLINYSNRLLSLQLNHRFNDRNLGKLVLTNSRYKYAVEYENEFNSDFLTSYNINETEVKAHMQFELNDKHEFNYGLSGKLYLVEPGEITPKGMDSTVQPKVLPQEKGIEGAIYIADDFKINDRLMLSGGLRYSTFSALGEGSEKVYRPGSPLSESSVIDTVFYKKNEVIETYGGPEVRVSARYFLFRDLSVKAGYNTMYQYIHTLSNNTTASPTDTYKLSDGHIKPQRGTQYSLGLYKNFENNMYELSLESYYKTSSDLLDYKVGAQLFLNENIETEILQGEGRSYGIEFLIKKTKGDLNGWVGYSYSRSYVKLDGKFGEEKVNNGDYFPSNYDKPHDFSLVGNYKFTQRFSFSANFVYQTGRPITYPVGRYTYNGAEYVMYSDRNEYRIPDYFRLDLGFNVEGNHKIKKFAHSFWNISIYNVLGRNNPYSVFFVTEEGEIKAYQSSIFSIPIPTITYNFKF